MPSWLVIAQEQGGALGDRTEHFAATIVEAAWGNQRFRNILCFTRIRIGPRIAYGTLGKPPLCQGGEWMAISTRSFQSSLFAARDVEIAGRCEPLEPGRSPKNLTN